MGLPSGEPARAPRPDDRPDVFIVEAGESRERRCSECGTRTARWKPVRRRGVSVVLCEDCAAKAAAPADAGACPSCGTVLDPGDRFCRKCGTPIEYACPKCGVVVAADDVFCGKCGTRLV